MDDALIIANDLELIAKGDRPFCPDSLNVAAKRLRELAAVERRFHDMFPLFVQARDALPGLSFAAASLLGVDPDLDRKMDAVGHMGTWEAMDAARGHRRSSDGREYLPP